MTSLSGEAIIIGAMHCGQYVVVPPLHHVKRPDFCGCLTDGRFDTMIKLIPGANWFQVFQTNDPEKSCSKVTNIIRNAKKRYIPSKCVIKKTGDPVWFDNHCWKAAIVKLHLFKKLKENKTQDKQG